MRQVSLAAIVGLLLACLASQSLDAQTIAPRITASGHSNGVFSIAWTNTGSTPVTVERRTSLTSGTWTAIASNNVTGTHSDSNAPSGVAFYRVVMASHTPNMVLVPAGSFLMGNQMDLAEGDADEETVHMVYISAFYMDQYEVTKALWDEVANWAAANGYDIDAGSAEAKAANHPASYVSWLEAAKWCNARSERQGLTPCYTVGGIVMKAGTSTPECNFSADGYRLPTEAEWEKAARGGLSGKRFPWGDTISHSQANYYSHPFYGYDVSATRGFHPIYETGSDPYGDALYSSPVGSFAPNGYGLYDMAGNVSEWCWDFYDYIYYEISPSSDPRGPSSGPGRLFRGGTWFHDANISRTANRYYNGPGNNSKLIGFRSVRSSVP